MIKGIAFDLEGIIINVESIHFDAFVRAAKEYGINVSFQTIVEEIPNAIGGGDTLIAEGISRLGGGTVSPEVILDRKRFLYDDIVQGMGTIPMRDGFREVLDYFIAQGLPIAIGSLTPTNQAKVLLERSGLRKLIKPENIVLKSDVKKLKPAPDVFLETARRLQVPPAEQLVFEDSATGVLAARAAGSHVIAIPVYGFTQNLVKIIEAGADRIFLNWREMNIAHVFKAFNKM